MLETKSLLEQKAASLTARAETVDDLQAELAALRVQVESVNQVRGRSGRKGEGVRGEEEGRRGDGGRGGERGGGGRKGEGGRGGRRERVKKCE